MKLSIVTSLYQSAPYIKEFYERMTAVARELVEDDYELIFVNDGSPDNSLELAIRLTKLDGHVVVIDLSRNFGHHKALMTGLAHSKGEHIFLIDSDLEEEPEYLISFFQQMTRDSCDVVYGVQEKRKGGWFERWSGYGFYHFLNTLTGLSIPKNVVTARLMTRRYVNALLYHKEREVFLAGLMHITGFDQRAQIVRKYSTSKTTYNFKRKLSLLVNSVTSFSNMPIVGIFYIGLVISFLASAYVIYLVFQWIFGSKPMIGWTSLIASIWLLGGMIISFIGVVGVYIAKIFSETKQRPYTIVRQIYGK